MPSSTKHARTYKFNRHTDVFILSFLVVFSLSFSFFFFDFLLGVVSVVSSFLLTDMLDTVVVVEETDVLATDDVDVLRGTVFWVFTADTVVAVVVDGLKQNFRYNISRRFRQFE